MMEPNERKKLIKAVLLSRGFQVVKIDCRSSICCFIYEGKKHLFHFHRSISADQIKQKLSQYVECFSYKA